MDMWSVSSFLQKKILDSFKVNLNFFFIDGGKILHGQFSSASVQRRVGQSKCPRTWKLDGSLRFSPIAAWLLRWPGQRLALSILVLQQRRRRLPDPLHDHADHSRSAAHVYGIIIRPIRQSGPRRHLQTILSTLFGTGLRHDHGLRNCDAVLQPHYWLDHILYVRVVEQRVAVAKLQKRMEHRA
jgi:hypothetical protein